jgi:hypothetical protein
VASAAPVGQEGACASTSVEAKLVEMAIELDSAMVPAGIITFDVSGSLTLDLAPCRYIIICKIPGHCLAGMRTELTVQ